MITGKKQVMWTLGAVILSVLGSVIGNGPGMAPGMCAKDKVYYKSTIFYVNGICGTTRKTCPSGGTMSVSKCYYRTKYRRCVKPRTDVRTLISTTYVCCPGYTVSSTGKCVPENCDWNMFGENCDQSCPCKEPYYSNCHRQSGLCNCSSGRTGLDCSKECVPGSYDRSCQSIFSCKNSSTCDPIDGKCNCTTPGYTGEKCHLACNGTTYGYDCQVECKCVWNNTETCNAVHGGCDCRKGYTGSNCSLDADITDLSALASVSAYYIHLGGIIGAVVVVAAVVVLFSILMRRSMCPLFRNTDGQQGQVYEGTVRHNNRNEEQNYGAIHIYHRCDNSDMAAAEGHGYGISSNDDSKMRENSYIEVLPDQKITSDT